MANLDLFAPLRGRCAFVTGASSGLGAHFAQTLARAGVGTLVLGARRADRLAAVVDRCRGSGAARVIEVLLDVTDEPSVEDAVDQVRVEAGRLDLLVNKAGVAETAAALDVGADAFDRVLDVNLRGAWLCAVAAARLMREGGRGGDIVNIASILGLRVAGGVAPYAVSKAGVVQMTKALALEWARFGIRVNALAPGYIGTDLNEAFFASEAGQAMVKRIPMRRLGRLEDLDAPFLLLASGASAYLTGAVLTVDGGHHCSSL